MAENVGKRSGSWFYRLELEPGLDGRRHQKRAGGFHSEREARTALARATLDVTRGRLRYSSAKTFSELATEWLEAIGPNRKATTLASYKMLVDAYLVPRIGSVRLDRLTTPSIQRLYVELRASGGRGGRALSGTQVRSIHRVLHNVLGYAQRMGYLAVNPTDQVERPKEDTAERSVYTPDQVRAFLLATTSDRLRALWYLAISTGLRRGELAGLRWQDLDLAGEPPSLHVRVTRSSAGKVVVESGPKTKAGRRTLILDSGTAQVLVRHRTDMGVEAQLRRQDALSDYVFVDEFGEPLRPMRLTRSLHLLQRQANLPQITLHDLRHTSATVALLAGVHPKVVSERHGHASVQITMDRYSHVLESMQISAAEAIGRFLEPASDS